MPGVPNNDGHLDLVVRDSSSRITALLGNGAGVFSPTGVAVSVQPSGAFRVIDLNHDGKLDLVISGVFSPQPAASVLLGTGTGTFGPETAVSVANYNSNAKIAGDFNGDGTIDLAVGVNSPRQVAILSGDGNGGFAPSITIPVAIGPFALLEVGDLNGDGTADLGVAWNPVAPGPFTQTLSLLLSNGAGGFGPLTDIVPGTMVAGT